MLSVVVLGVAVLSIVAPELSTLKVLHSGRLILYSQTLDI
jgi:hypothetical protein